MSTHIILTMEKPVDTSLSPDIIFRKIYILRNKRVILDRDLADFYGVKTRRLREQVKRNSLRFPSDFMFQLTLDESKFVVSQFATPSMKTLGGSLPYAFTEHGALMLSSVLSSERASLVGIIVVRAFVYLREMLTEKIKIADLKKDILSMQKKYDAQFNHIFDAIDRLISPPEPDPSKKIGFR